MEDSPTPLAEILALLRGPTAERLCLLGNCGRVRPHRSPLDSHLCNATSGLWLRCS
jgi:hypothetical protein